MSKARFPSFASHAGASERGPASSSWIYFRGRNTKLPRACASRQPTAWRPRPKNKHVDLSLFPSAPISQHQGSSYNFNNFTWICHFTIDTYTNPLKPSVADHGECCWASRCVQTGSRTVRPPEEARVVRLLIVATIRIFQSNEFSDFEIRSGSQSFKVHKAVICAQSAYFRAPCAQFKVGGGVVVANNPLLRLRTHDGAC